MSVYLNAVPISLSSASSLLHFLPYQHVYARTMLYHRRTAYAHYLKPPLERVGENADEVRQAAARVRKEDGVFPNPPVPLLSTKEEKDRDRDRDHQSGARR